VYVDYISYSAVKNRRIAQDRESDDCTVPRITQETDIWEVAVSLVETEFLESDCLSQVIVYSVA
jgi:hypothetical protein